MTFETALDFTLRQETGGTKADGYRAGALHTDPSDPGGATKYGIAARSHPGVDVANLTLEAATEIYRDQYWVAGQCGLLPPKVSVGHFEACVNLGVDAASRILQVVVGARPDGIIGKNTLAAVSRFALARGTSEFARELIARRILYYSRDQNFERYGLGWIRRCISLAALVG